jgi:Tfp pilus assembly protein PilF
MKLTLDETLQKAVAFHEDGKIQDAERLYQAIVQSQPTHPDANHNLGVLAVSGNKAGAALSLFKTALKANPKKEQFWFSYIDALIKEKKYEAARQVIEQVKSKGMAADKLIIFEKQLLSQNQASESQLALQKKNSTFGERRQKLTVQKKQNKKKRHLNANYPSQEQVNKLLQHYQTGRFSDAEELAVDITHEFPSHQLGWKILGALYKQTGRNSEAVDANQTAVALSPRDAEAHNNLGVTLKELGKLNEAEASYTQAIALKPDYAEAYSNLGITLKQRERFDEAEAIFRQAIALKPNYAEVHNNLGSALKELGRLDEAEASLRQAIALKPNYPEVYYNFGNVLKKLGRLDEAEASFRQAITLKPDYAEAYSNLGVVLHMSGNIDSGLEELEKAHNIDPTLQNNEIILAILNARNVLEITESSADDTCNRGYSSERFSQPVILKRAIEADLVPSLYKVKSVELDNFDNSRFSDPRFGDGKCSRNFKLFEDDSPVIKSVAEDLTIIMKKVVNSDIYISESFFNIFKAGGGALPHVHLVELDADEYLNFGKQKYSLVYYLSVGDQNCMDPGILKLYDPSEDILPYEGMIVIFPAGRKHSALYGGEKDRVMIGVNFYCL